MADVQLWQSFALMGAVLTGEDGVVAIASSDGPPALLSAVLAAHGFQDGDVVRVSVELIGRKPIEPAKE